MASHMGFLELLQRRHRPAPSVRTEPGGLAASAHAGRHPSVDPGIAACSVDDLLASEAELLQRFKYCYGCDAETFERDIVAPIRRYASYVNLLPATADNFFCSAGGLFRLGLEVAFFALQPGIQLALFPRASLALEAGVAEPPSGTSGCLLSHNVARREQVAEVMAQAAAAGARILRAARDTAWGGHAGYFQDPDGHPWEVAWNPKWPVADD